MSLDLQWTAKAVVGWEFVMVTCHGDNGTILLEAAKQLSMLRDNAKITNTENRHKLFKAFIFFFLKLPLNFVSDWFNPLGYEPFIYN